MRGKLVKVFMSAFLMLLCVVPVAGTASAMLAEPAQATIYIDGDPIENTWEPKNMISTDQSVSTVSAKDAPSRLMDVLAKLVTLLMPLVIIACVVILVFNAGRNLFVKPEQRVPVGELVKNMFINFFWIFAAPIVVEVIVFLVTNGETILFATIFE